MQNDIFSTKDLHLAAFLKLNGVVLTKMERKRDEFRNPVFFMFIDRERCQYLHSVFWDGEGEEVVVNVKEYVSLIRELRAMTASVEVSN